MLYTIILIILVLWLVGFLAVPAAGNAVHLLLVVVLVIVIVRLMQGRRIP